MLVLFEILLIKERLQARTSAEVQVQYLIPHGIQHLMSVQQKLLWLLIVINYHCLSEYNQCKNNPYGGAIEATIAYT